MLRTLMRNPSHLHYAWLHSTPLKRITALTNTAVVIHDSLAKLDPSIEYQANEAINIIAKMAIFTKGAEAIFLLDDLTHQIWQFSRLGTHD